MMQSWYDYRLVILSIIVAMVAAHLALAIASRIRDHGVRLPLWLGGGAVAMGLGIWAMHFIGMLAYHLPITVGYDIPFTLLSLLLAIIASAFALFIIFSSEELDLLTNTISALLMGAGIAGMHYVGIYAMQFSPPIRFDAVLFTASLLIAFAASFFALRFAFASSRSTTLFDSNKSIAAIIMGLAIAGMHYTAMASQRIDANAICLTASGGIEHSLLALIVAVAVFAVLLTTAIVLNYDMRLLLRERQHAVELAEQRDASLAEAAQIAEELSRDYRRSEQFANELFDTLGAVALVLTRKGIVVRFNKGAERLSGYAREEVIGRSIWEKLIPHEQLVQAQYTFAHLLAHNFPSTDTYSWRTRTGELRLISWSNTALFDESGEVEYVIATGVDITEQQRAQEELRLAAVAFNTNEAIVITDANGAIMRTNKPFSEITGYSPEEVVGKTTSLLKSGKHDALFYRTMWERLQQLGYWMGEIWNRRKSGEVYPEWLKITAVKNEQGAVSHYVGSFSDISALKETEKQLSYLSNYDPPTGLPNKHLFHELLTKQVVIARHDREQGLLFYLRLEQLRRLNETLGMRIVDEYIARFKTWLVSLVGSHVLVGRLSGGDFAIAIGGIRSDEELTSLGSNIAESLITYVKKGEQINGIEIHPGINIGIASHGAEELDTELLLQHAMTALTRASQKGSNSYQFYSAALHRQASVTYHMEVALRRAVELRELSLQFEPQLDSNEQLVGAEALLRWNHDGVAISPGIFIPLAERVGLIDELGSFVFEEGCRWLARFIDAGLPPTFGAVALNISPRQFENPLLLEQLRQAIFRAQVPPQRLKIEITESVLLEEPQRVIEIISKMKELGIQVALDDFGTGYSSLSYLHKLPLDQLKIDQSFVRDLTINPHSRAITETIIAMAHRMELDVIAEGVESRAEMELLKEMGCQRFQGYCFSRPIAGEEFCKLL